MQGVWLKGDMSSGTRQPRRNATTTNNPTSGTNPVPLTCGGTNITTVPNPHSDMFKKEIS